MISELLTIVIPTRDRPELLEKCLGSIFECQPVIPHVMVSDNSTCDQPAMAALRRKYDFVYVRQSGDLNMVQHWNTCLGLPSTPWELMLHDDDELYPDSLGNLEPFLVDCDGVGIVVGGIQFINFQGEAVRQWIPPSKGKFMGEEGLVRLGLDWKVRPPGIIVNVPASLQAGGFVGIEGLPADYTFALQLAYSYGVAFFPALVGRYRLSPYQQTNFSTPEKTADWLEFSRRQAEVVQTFGCSDTIAARIVDYMTWWPFLTLAPRWLSSQSSFVFKLTQHCVRQSPRGGDWQLRARRQYPFLFSRPYWLAWSLLRELHKPVRLVKRLRRQK